MRNRRNLMSIESVPEESSMAMSEHTMRHKFPWYAFFQQFKPTGQPWLHARDSAGRVMLPVPLNDGSYSHLEQDGVATSEDISFLKSKGALDLPSPDITQELLSKYFRFLHPFFPIIDREAFLLQFRQAEQGNTGPSLVLLQAVLFTAVPV